MQKTARTNAPQLPSSKPKIKSFSCSAGLSIDNKIYPDESDDYYNNCRKISGELLLCYIMF